MSYNAFSEFYDLLMVDAQYDERAEYVLGLFREFGATPTLLLDLGCGSGEFTKRFAEAGIETIGVDPSEDMLGIAREKLPDGLFLNQSGAELDLYGTVDGAVSLMDSLNHITDYEEFCETLQKVSLFLEPEKLFIFDVNTEYKHREILGDNAFITETDEVMCCWQNYTDETLKTDIYLDFFTEKEDGMYRRESDEFSERAYSPLQIEKALEKAGLKALAIYNDMTRDPQSETSERVYYITKKVN